MHKAEKLPLSYTVVTKSGKLNFLETYGPLRACNGTDLPFYRAGNVVSSRHEILLKFQLKTLISVSFYFAYNACKVQNAQQNL